MQRRDRHPDLREAVAKNQRIRRGEETDERVRYEKHSRLRKLESEIDDARLLLAEKELALYRHKISTLDSSLERSRREPGEVDADDEPIFHRTIRSMAEAERMLHASSQCDADDDDFM